MKITISVEGTNRDSNKQLINIIDDILFNKGANIPDGITVEFKNIRTRNRVSKKVPTHPAPEASVAASN